MYTLIIIFAILFGLKFENHPLEPFIGPTRLRTILKMTGLFVFLIFFVLFDLNLVAHLYVEHEVNVALGFNYTTPELTDGEIFLITEVDSGKFMEKAGLKVDDIVCYDKVSDLYHLLLFNQHRKIAIPIIRNGNKMSVDFVVPEIPTNINPDRLWWWL